MNFTAALNPGSFRLPRRLLAAVHEVGPRFESEVDQLRDLLAVHVPPERLALLVVPDHWRDRPVTAGSPFAARLRGWADSGTEIFVHGWRHDDGAAGDIKPTRKARQPVTGKPAKRRYVGVQAAAATSNVGRGQLQAELLIAWAKQAGGTLKLAHFRAANEGKTRGIKHSFYTTTMYTKVGKLTEQGVFSKIGPGEYRLNDSKG